MRFLSGEALRLRVAAVYDNFESARQDILEAGNCLAAECCTGAVFHLMRAAEVARRVFGADRQVTFPKGTIDSKQWGEIIGQLEKAVVKLGQDDSTNWPSDAIRQSQIRFCNWALIEFRAFNDAWRRHISHAHEGATYDRDQAMSVLQHTKAFMVKLASRLSEHSTGPKYWTI